MNTIDTKPNALTVKQLKELVRDWPETNHMGEPTEVWITTGDMLSSPCVNAMSLNYRVGEQGNESADLLLSPNIQF